MVAEGSWAWDLLRAPKSLVATNFLFQKGPNLQEELGTLGEGRGKDLGGRSEKVTQVDPRPLGRTWRESRGDM